MAEFNCKGEWDVIQAAGGNAHFNVQAQLPDGLVVATASQPAAPGVVGSGIGRADGRGFSLRITWSNDTVGVYSGALDPERRLTGTGFDEKHPEFQTTRPAPEHFDLANVLQMTGN